MAAGRTECPTGRGSGTSAGDPSPSDGTPPPTGDTQQTNVRIQIYEEINFTGDHPEVESDVDFWVTEIITSGLVLSRITRDLKERPGCEYMLADPKADVTIEFKPWE